MWSCFWKLTSVADQVWNVGLDICQAGQGSWLVSFALGSDVFYSTPITTGLTTSVCNSCMFYLIFKRMSTLYGYPFLFFLITDFESFMYFNLDWVFSRVLSMRLAGNLCRIVFSSWLADFSLDLYQCFVTVLTYSFMSSVQLSCVKAEEEESGTVPHRAPPLWASIQS